MVSSSSIHDDISVHSQRPHSTIEEIFPGENEALLQYYDTDLGHIDLSRVKGPICGECKVKYGDPENLPDKYKKATWKDWFFVFFKIFVILLLLAHLAVIMVMEYYTLYDLSGAWLLETTLLHGIPSYMAVLWVLICMFMRAPKCWCFCVYKTIPWCVCKCGRVTKKTVDDISACLHKVIIGVAICYFLQIFALMGTNAGMYHSVWPSKIHCECSPLSDTMAHHNTTKHLTNLYECDCFIPHDEVFMRKFIIPEVTISELQKAFIRDGVYIDISGYEPHHLFYGVIPPPRNHTDDEFPDVNATSDGIFPTTSQPVDLETTEETLTTSGGSFSDENKPSTKGSEQNNPKKPDIENNNPGKTNDATSLPKRIKRNQNSLERFKRQDENITDAEPTIGEYDDQYADPSLPIDGGATYPDYSSSDAIQQAKAAGPKQYRSPTLTFVTIEKPYFKMMLLILQMTAITCIFLLTVFSGLDILRDHPKINKAVTIYIGMWSKGFVNVFDAMVLYDDLFEEVQYFKDEPTVMLWILLVIEYAIAMVPFEYMLTKECLHKSKVKYGALVSLKAFIIIAYNGPFVWMRIELITQESGGSERKGLVSMLMMVKEIFFIFVSMIQMIITNCKPEIRDGFYVFKFAPDSLKMDIAKHKEDDGGGEEGGGEEEGGGGGLPIDKIVNFFKRREGEDKNFFRRMRDRIPFIGKRFKKKKGKDEENKDEPETGTKGRQRATQPPGSSNEPSDSQQKEIPFSIASMAMLEGEEDERFDFDNINISNKKPRSKSEQEIPLPRPSIQDIIPKDTKKKWMDGTLHGRKSSQLGDSNTPLNSLSGHIPTKELFGEMNARRQSLDSGFESCSGGVSMENLSENLGCGSTNSLDKNYVTMGCYGDCEELSFHEGLSRHLYHYDVMPLPQEIEVRVVADGKSERPRSGTSNDDLEYGQAEGGVVEDGRGDPSKRDSMLGKPKWLFEDPQKRHSTGPQWYVQPPVGGDADYGMTLDTITSMTEPQMNAASPGDGDGDPKKPKSYRYKLIQKCVICGKYFLIDSTPKVNRVLGAISDIPINDNNAKKALLQVIAKHFPQKQKQYVPPSRAYRVLPKCMKPKTTDDIIQESQMNLIPEDEEYTGYEVKGIGEELFTDLHFGGASPRLRHRTMVSQETQTMDLPYVPLMRTKHKQYLYNSDDTNNYSPATDQWSNYFDESLSSLSMGTESTSFMYKQPKGRPKSVLPYSSSGSYGAYDLNRPKLRKSESDRRKKRTSWGEENKTTAEVHMEYEKAMKFLEETLDGRSEPTPVEKKPAKTEPLSAKSEFPKFLDDLINENDKELQKEKKDPDIQDILTNLQSQLPPERSLNTEKEETLPETRYEKVGTAKEPAKKVDSSIALYDVECGIEMVPPEEVRKKFKSDVKKAPLCKTEVPVKHDKSLKDDNDKPTEKPRSAVKATGKTTEPNKYSDKSKLPLDGTSDKAVEPKTVLDDKKPKVPPDGGSGPSTPVRLKKPSLPIFSQDFAKNRDTPDRNVKDRDTNSKQDVPEGSKSTPPLDQSPDSKAWRQSWSKLKPYLVLTQGTERDDPTENKSMVPKKTDRSIDPKMTDTPDKSKDNDGLVIEEDIMEEQIAPRQMNAPVVPRESSEELVVTPGVFEQPDVEKKVTDASVTEPEVKLELVPRKKHDQAVTEPKKTDEDIIEEQVLPRKINVPVEARESSEELVVTPGVFDQPDVENKVYDAPVTEPEVELDLVAPKKLDQTVLEPKKTSKQSIVPKKDAPNETDGKIKEPEVTVDLVATRKTQKPVVEREKSEEPEIMLLKSNGIFELKNYDTPVVEPELTVEPVEQKKMDPQELVPKKTANPDVPQTAESKCKPGRLSSIPVPTRQTSIPFGKTSATSGGENVKPKCTDSGSMGQGQLTKMASPTGKQGKQDRQGRHLAYSSTDEEDVGEKKKAKPPPRLLKARPESMKRKEGESSPSGRESDDPGIALEPTPEGDFAQKDTASSEIKETTI